jgi:hypothetical protein
VCAFVGLIKNISWIKLHRIKNFKETISPCSSLNVRDQASHPYKRTGKITVLYVLMFIFLDNKLEGNRFCAELYQALPDFKLLLISS